MVKNLKIMLVFSLIISLFTACVEDLEPAHPDEPLIEVPEAGEDNNNENTPDSSSDSTNFSNDNNQNAFEMGTGSGNLVIDGNNAALKGKKLILVKAGKYRSITVKNLTGTVGAPVVIKNEGQVYITSEMDISHVSNVIISGDNIPSVKYGFNLHDISYRAMYLGSRINGLTIQNFSFKNVVDYVIYSTVSNEPYLGTLESRTEGLKILNSKFDHASSISFTGSFDKNEDLGFVNDVEIANNIIQNGGGSLAYFGNVQNYNIHHNTVNNFNETNNNHNGVFFMQGAGKFHNNKLTNYQGNAIRAWLYSRVNNPVPVEIYNNTCYNTRKYGAFEIQGFDYHIVPGKTVFANAKVYNNTAGRMNTSNDWAGVMLDVYDYGGTLEFFNNLGFEMKTSDKETITSMINNMSSVSIIVNKGNKYFPKASEAVTGDLNSLHPGIGAKH